VRAAAAFVGLLLVCLAADDRVRAGTVGVGPVLVVYVGAEDCGPCRTWRRRDKPGLLQSLGEAGSYREVIAPRLVAAFSDDVWPSDLRRFRPDAEAVAGVPLWLVVRDGRVVVSAGGLSRWQSTVLPALRKPRRD
jgi:hypothetical protein